MAKVHEDSTSGQQFHVRYSRDEEGTVRTYWSYVYDSQEKAEEVKTDWLEEDRIYGVEIFVRDVSPWRPL